MKNSISIKRATFFETLLAIVFLSLSLSGSAQVDFNTNFLNGRLRMDFRITGNEDTAEVSQVEFIREADWGGSRTQLIDTFRYGEMMVEVYDSLTGNLIYSRGFSTLFQEWQTTEEAKSYTNQFEETLLMPYPRKAARIDLLIRRGADFEILMQQDFNPRKTRLVDRKPRWKYDVVPVRESGSHEDKLDILLLAEGYTADDEDKFLATANRLTASFLEHEPWASHQDQLNIYAVFIPSQDTGADDPVNYCYVTTPLCCTFNTFGSDRYMTSAYPREIYDMVTDLVFDQLIILVNTEKYGGGAIFNKYTFLSAENEDAEFLMLHEFGHAFAALADEYYTSSVAYTEYFDLTIEPYQPNITTRVDFDRKWKDMVPDSVPVPTPDTEEFQGVTGVFEGAGYSAHGIFRPFYTCIMKSRSTDFFCPVCQRAIAQMLGFYAP